MSVQAVQSAVRSRLIAEGVWTSSSAFTGPPKTPDPATGMPHKACFVHVIGGGGVVRVLGSISYKPYDVQVIVRGAPQEHDEANDLAADTWIALDERQDESEFNGRYLRVVCAQAAPFFVMIDDGQHALYSVNARAWYDPNVSLF